MVDEAQLGAGDVRIVLDGEEKVLRPTLRAAQQLSRQADGLRGAIARVASLDFDVIVQIIGLGLDYTPGGPELKTLPDKVYRTGLGSECGNLAALCVEFVDNLANGGRKQSARSDPQ